MFFSLVRRHLGDVAELLWGFVWRWMNSIGERICLDWDYFTSQVKVYSPVTFIYFSLISFLNSFREAWCSSVSSTHLPHLGSLMGIWPNMKWERLCLLATGLQCRIVCFPAIHSTSSNDFISHFESHNKLK